MRSKNKICCQEGIRNTSKMSSLRESVFYIIYAAICSGKTFTPLNFTLIFQILVRGNKEAFSLPFGFVDMLL